MSCLILLTSIIALTASFGRAKPYLPDALSVTYWGQASGRSLAETCDSGNYDVVILGFVNSFGSSPYNLQMNAVGCSSPGVNGQSQTGCAAISADIMHCQAVGVLISISMGGALEAECHCGGGTYLFQSLTQAQQSADLVWQMFFNSGLSTPNVWRPFGNALLDGIDLDIEGKTVQPYFPEFISHLLAYDPNLLVSGAPVCYRGCSTGNCQNLEQDIPKIPFDVLFIQWYNDDRCSLSTPYFQSALSGWNAFAGAGARFLIGVPGDMSSTSTIDPKYFLPASQVVSAVAASRQSWPARKIGVGIWNSETALTSNFGSDVRLGIEHYRESTYTFSLAISQVQIIRTLKNTGDNVIMAFMPVKGNLNYPLPLGWRTLGSQLLGSVGSGQILYPSFSIQFTTPPSTAVELGFVDFTRVRGLLDGFGTKLVQFGATSMAAEPKRDQPEFNATPEDYYNYLLCEAPLGAGTFMLDTGLLASAAQYRNSTISKTFGHDGTYLGPSSGCQNAVYTFTFTLSRAR